MQWLYSIKLLLLDENVKWNKCVILLKLGSVRAMSRKSIPS